MPLSKKRMRECKKLDRANVKPVLVAQGKIVLKAGTTIYHNGIPVLGDLDKPNLDIVKPKEEVVIPNLIAVDSKPLTGYQTRIEGIELQPWEVTDWKSYKGEVVPIPNYPDGRYRA